VQLQRVAAAQAHGQRVEVWFGDETQVGQPTLLLSIHGFTPELAGQRRPWDIAISYGRDRRLAALMLEALEANAKFVVGDNEPYPVDDAIDYTIPVHGEGRGLPHALVEIRQDGIAMPADAAAWAMRLAETYAQVEPAALRLFETPR
jgi:predicted N-formylglutamate amidohydrolase